ncbi:FAD dependent oxidoreductase [Purpureocillium lavendulum]|uniref:FAD dependent oxidoreductase n=1 Tax=Purpureocillium lavendulum TaxID=1247861 RepID=A0AB34G7I6_9HYPO|nr:FAD dependent oxidoreductase [Purpureocillium lavendulum]
MSKRPCNVVVADMPFQPSASKKARHMEYPQQKLSSQSASYMPAALPYDYSYVTSPTSSDYGYTPSPAASSDVSSLDFTTTAYAGAGASPGASSSGGDFVAPYAATAANPAATFDTNPIPNNNTAVSYALPSSSSTYAAPSATEQYPTYTQADLESCFDDDFDLEVEINTAMGLRMRPRPTESSPMSAVPFQTPGAGLWPSLPPTYGMQVHAIPGGPSYASQFPNNGQWTYPM